MFKSGADIAKVATTAQHIQDAARVLALPKKASSEHTVLLALMLMLACKQTTQQLSFYSHFVACFCMHYYSPSRMPACIAGPVIALAMGEKGVVSRLLAPKHGAFLTFGALSAEKASAAGQPLLTELKGLYGLPQQSASTQVGEMPPADWHLGSPRIHVRHEPSKALKSRSADIIMNSIRKHGGTAKTLSSVHSQASAHASMGSVRSKLQTWIEA